MTLEVHDLYRLRVLATSETTFATSQTFTGAGVALDVRALKRPRLTLSRE